MEEDINAMDKQCFLIVQHIILEHVKSTILHLEVIEAFLEVFNGQRKSLE
jgi:hypothetical protein